MRKAIVGTLLALGVLILYATSASAHHPEVSAVNQCITNTAAISVTTTAWESEPDHRVNNSVLVTARNVATNESQVVATGQFNAGNNYSFSAYFIGSAGATYVIRSTAQVAWGTNQEFGSQGEFRETTITQQPPCLQNPPPPPPPNTLTPPPTTVITPPTTVTTVAPTTTVPTQGTIDRRTRETVLANTGIDAFYGTIVAFLLIGIGTVLVRRKMNHVKR